MTGSAAADGAPTCNIEAAPATSTHRRVGFGSKSGMANLLGTGTVGPSARLTHETASATLTCAGHLAESSLDLDTGKAVIFLEA
jgi:hypothetical protein